MNRRVILPLLLATVGFLLLGGCVFIPTFHETVGGTDVKSKVGGRNSNKPLRVNQSTQREVEAVLGAPRVRSADGRFALYFWEIRHGTWVYLLCGTTANDDGRAWAELEYDSHRVLRNVRFTHSGTRWPLFPVINDFQENRVYPDAWKDHYPDTPQYDDSAIRGIRTLDPLQPATRPISEPLHLWQ